MSCITSLPRNSSDPMRNVSAQAAVCTSMSAWRGWIAGGMGEKIGGTSQLRLHRWPTSLWGCDANSTFTDATWRPIVINYGA